MTFHFVMSHLLQDECARILRRSSVRDAGVGVIASSLAIVYYRVDDPNSGTPLGRRMTSRKKKRDRRAEKVRWVQERIEVDNARRMATAAAAAAAAAEK